ncbi:hypothetical protein, partial [Streptomyces hygroscopicus]|uniref:hypothetical protein n=1 Tax=Streptomyces hygroscopicus TaxID=1912 RepID=UPI0036CC1C10
MSAFAQALEAPGGRDDHLRAAAQGIGLAVDRRPADHAAVPGWGRYEPGGARGVGAPRGSG